MSTMNIEVHAKHLLFDKGLLINGIQHTITELEIYCRCKDHDDPYVHTCEEQLQYGKWYFHRHKNGTYKGGTYKGVDITFGNKDMYYSALIRSITGPDGLVEGPCNVVNYILKQYNLDSINQLVDPDSQLTTKSTQNCLDVFDNHRSLHLIDVPTSTLTFKPVYVGPRVGLNPKTDAEWCHIQYRYATTNVLKRLRSQLTLLDLTL
jgi:hypothetical protein